MPDDPNIPSRAKITRETLDMLAGPAQGPQTSLFLSWWKPKSKYSWESVQRFLAFLMLSFALGVLICIAVPSTRHNTIALLGEAGRLSLTHMGTTALAVLLGMSRFIQTSLPHWRSDMRKLWNDIGKGATVTVIVWSGLFVFCIFEAAKNDHQTQSKVASGLRDENTRLTAENSHLANNDTGAQIKTAEDEARSERDNARRWREAYEGVSHGELHPDRHLDREDQRKLREDLERIAKDPRNKDYIKLDFGMNTNPETQQIGWQIYMIFREAHWNVPPKAKTDFPKEVRDQMQSDGGANYASGIFVFTDTPERGRYLGMILKSCCGLQSIVNPRGIPQNFKGTMLWIGNKQFTVYKDND